MENNIEKRDADVIDLRVVFKKVLAKKKVFFITLPIVFVLSCAIIVCVPKYYTPALCWHRKWAAISKVELSGH